MPHATVRAIKNTQNIELNRHEVIFIKQSAVSSQEPQLWQIPIKEWGYFCAINLTK